MPLRALPQPPLLAVVAIIKTLGLERDFTQEGLAAAAELNLSYLAAVERADNNPTLMTLLAIATALDVTLEQLASRSGI